ncbi:hypothetical protein DPSP01_006971 [Paraphaeosphaeria sporulosa]
MCAGGKFYDVFRPLYKGKPLDTVFTTSDPALNKHLKHTLLVNLLNKPQLFSKEIDYSVDVFIEQTKAAKGDSIDFSSWTFYWAFDMTYALVFGDHFGYMASRKDFNGMVSSFKTIVRSAAVLGQVPQWCPATLANKTFMGFCRSFRSFPDPTIQLLEEIERKIHNHDTQSHSCGNSLLCRVLSDGKHKLEENAYDEAVNVLFEAFLAAAGEVAVSLTTIIYCLLKDQRVYTKLAKIVRSNTDADHTYVNAVIKEALRVHTSNSPPIERVVPAGGLNVDGYFVKEGTVLGIPQYLAHRDQAVFGADAEHFRPERWLEADAATVKSMDQNFMTGAAVAWAENSP